MLGTSEAALHTAHDLVMLDLDGVVYVGAEAVAGAAAGVEAARAAGAHVAFVTNNAARPPSVVAAHLTRIGVTAVGDDVVTSAQAAARLLLERHGAGAPVWVLGAEGLRRAVEEAGLVPVEAPGADGRQAADPVGLVTGYGPDVRWWELMRAAVHVAAGLPWVATNADHSLPTPQGRAPGHGVLVRMIEDFTGVRPTVAGKPERPLLDETVRRVGGRRPLMVGDRLDTDIAGAARAGMDSLLVLTGVTGLDELVSAPAGMRPTYLSHGLGGLGQAHHAPVPDGGHWSAGRWSARVAAGRLVVAEASGRARRQDAGADVGADRSWGADDDWWRAAACAAWAHLDATGEVVDTAGLRPPVVGPGPRAG